MASAAPDETPVARMKRLLTCYICLDTLEDPRTLGCFHSFCKCCLHKYVKGQREKAAGKVIEAFDCPVCRTEFSLKQGEQVEGILPNHFINDVLKVLEIQPCAEELPCFSCRSTKPAVSNTTCDHNLCSKRVVSTMDELAKPENQDKARSKSRCLKHENKTLKFYCETCKELVCRYCMYFTHVRPDHVCFPIAEVAEKHRETLRASCAILDEQLKEGNTVLQKIENNTESSTVKNGDQVTGKRAPFPADIAGQVTGKKTPSTAEHGDQVTCKRAPSTTDKIGQANRKSGPSTAENSDQTIDKVDKSVSSSADNSHQMTGKGATSITKNGRQTIGNKATSTTRKGCRVICGQIVAKSVPKERIAINGSRRQVAKQPTQNDRQQVVLRNLSSSSRLFRARQLPVEETGRRNFISLSHMPTTPVERGYYHKYWLLVLTIAGSLLKRGNNVARFKEWARQFHVRIDKDVIGILLELDQRQVISALDFGPLKTFLGRIGRRDLLQLIDQFLLGNYSMLYNGNLNGVFENRDDQQGTYLDISPAEL